MVEIGRSWGPIRSPTNEPNHLLPSANVVDNGSSCIFGEDSRWAKLGDCSGNAAVGNGCWVMVESLGRHCGAASFEVSKCLEVGFRTHGIAYVFIPA